jgi:hypothetical protein
MNPKPTKRDVAVLVDVYKYRYLSVSQVEALHFPSRRTAYRRLQALTALSYLKAFTVPSIPERIYYLDKPGAEVVAGEMQVEVDDLNWHRSMRAPKDYYFLRHFLAINDFRIALTRACEDSPMTLLGFIPEYVGEKTREGNVKKYLRDQVCDITNTSRRISHTPDAAFALGKEGKAALFFVEIDRGIEVLNDPEKGFLKCISFYLNYWSERKFNRYEQEFGGQFQTFRTLIVTSSEKRLENMREAVTKYPFPNNYAKRFLWGATNVNKELMFAPIWQSLDVNDATHYKIG